MTRDAARPPTLLLVDDEERILSALRRTLRREGYEILTADRVEEALSLLDAHAIDLVVCDHRMPRMSGIDFLRRVQARRPEAARVLLTGWPEAVPPADLEAAGVAALLTKPWDDAEFKRAIQKALS